MGILGKLLKDTTKELVKLSKTPTSTEQTHNNIALSAKFSVNMPDIELYPSIKKRYKPLLCGLYPPEILLVYYCEHYQRYTPRTKDFQKFWLNYYGITDVCPMLESLLKRDYIKISSSDKNPNEICYRATERGLSAIAYYDCIVWSHKQKFELECEIGVWGIGYSLERHRQKTPNYPYRDIIWNFYNNKRASYAQTVYDCDTLIETTTDKLMVERYKMYADSARSSFMMYTKLMADFLYDEKRYKAALSTYEHAAKCEILDYERTRQRYPEFPDRNPVPPHVLDRIELCKKHLAKSND